MKSANDSTNGLMAGLGGIDEAVRGDHRLLRATGQHQCEAQVGLAKCVSVATACKLGAAQLDRPFGPTDGGVHTEKEGFETERRLVAATAEKHLAGVAVADSRLDPPYHPAQRRHRVQEREPPMIGGAGGLDKLFGPGDRLMVFDREPRCPA